MPLLLRALSLFNTALDEPDQKKQTTCFSLVTKHEAAMLLKVKCCFCLDYRAEIDGSVA